MVPLAAVRVTRGCEGVLRHRVLLLILRRHLRRDFRWRFGVAVEALPVSTPAMGNRVQGGGILVQLGLRQDGAPI